jgi:hypothetical protein
MNHRKIKRPKILFISISKCNNIKNLFDNIGVPHGVLGVNEIEVIHGEPFFGVLVVVVVIVVGSGDGVLPASGIVGFDQVEVIHGKSFL